MNLAYHPTTCLRILHFCGLIFFLSVANSQSNYVDQLVEHFYEEDTVAMYRLVDSMQAHITEDEGTALNMLGTMLVDKMKGKSIDKKQWLDSFSTLITKESALYGEYCGQKLIYDHERAPHSKMEDQLVLEALQDSLYFTDRVMADIYHNAAVGFYKDGLYELGKAYALKAYHSVYADNNLWAKARYANALGSLSKDSKQETLEYLNYAIQHGSPGVQVPALANLAVYYGKNMNLDSALYCINKAIDLNTSLIRKNKDLYGTRGNVYLTMKSYSKALDDYHMDFRFIHEQDSFSLAVNRLNVGVTYNLMKQQELAKSSFEEALGYARNLKNYRLREHLMKQLKLMYKEDNQLDKQIDILEKQLTLKDSIASHNRSKFAEEMQAKYDVKEAQSNQERAELVSRNLSDKNKRQLLFLIASAVLISLIALLSFLLYRQVKRQKQLNATLVQQRDKIDVLHRELNHRVKNNLSFMTSLLEMQGRRIEQVETRQIFKESESRLKALSLMHQNNYFQQDNSIEINLKQYIEEIVEQLQQIFDLPNKKLQIRTSLVDIEYDAEQAMRIAMIVNELVTNSIKHAFELVENPEIHITTSQSDDGKILMQYRDNGKGYIPTAQVTTNLNTESIGTKLIQLLERQLADSFSLQIQ